MNRLSVAEVARLVGRSPAFVRQHVRRGHLRVEREGRRVLVRRGEVLRWVRERDLAPVEGVKVELDHSGPAAPSQRMARVRILAVRVDGVWQNLLTTVRQRGGSAAGVPAHLPHDFGDEVSVIGGDLALVDAQELVQRALTGALAIGNEVIEYGLGFRQQHFAGRGESSKELVEEAMSSPFADHSSKVDEHWSESAPSGPVVDRVLERFEPWGGRFGMNLARYDDRRGNLLVFDAIDEISADFGAEGGAVRVRADFGPGADPEGYVAALSLYLGDDIVVREMFSLHGRSLLKRYDTDWDACHLRVFRNRDGRCVDDLANHMLREISLRTQIAEPDLSLRDRRGKEFRRLKRSTHGFDSSLQLGPEHEAARSRQLARRARNLKTKAEKDGWLLRCEPDERDRARSHLVRLVGEAARGAELVYVADPYFFRAGFQDEFMRDLFLDLVEAASGASLRILHGLEAEGTRSWGSLPKALTNRVDARSVRRLRGSDGDVRSGFHDRFVASRSAEFLFTHSINGWHTDGVTFVRLPGGGVYHSIAEELWNRPANEAWLVENIWK